MRKLFFTVLIIALLPSLAVCQPSATLQPRVIVAPSGSELRLVTEGAQDIVFMTNDTVRMRMDGTTGNLSGSFSLELANDQALTSDDSAGTGTNDDTVLLSNASQDINFNPAGTERGRWTSAGVLEIDNGATIDGGLTMSATSDLEYTDDWTIQASSAAGDTESIMISGCNGFLAADGGTLILYGGAHGSNPDDVTMSTGDGGTILLRGLGTSSAVELRSEASSGQITFSSALGIDFITNSTQTWDLDTNGKFTASVATAIMDLSGGRTVLSSGTTLPASCLVGEWFHDTDSDDCADTGSGDGAICVCKSANTYALVANI